MKHGLCVVSMLWASVIGATFLSGCATVESRWQEAQQQNNVGAYERFIRDYTGSSYVPMAKDHIDQLSFEQARTVGTEQAYERYLKDFPNGRFTEEANKATPHLAFEKASRANTIQAYEDFGAKHPNHELATTAGEKARTLRFEVAKTSESVSTIEDFLKRYPQGADSETLKQELPAVREWEPRKQLGELIIRLCPKVTAGFLSSLAGKDRSTPSATYKEDLAEIRSLLERGVDPNAVRIEGFVASVEQSSVDTSGGVLRMSFNFSPGSPGRPVPASKGGMTLLEYCAANKLMDAESLLKSQGAK
jgi:hypothetical protein